MYCIVEEDEVDEATRISQEVGCNDCTHMHVQWSFSEATVGSTRVVTSQGDKEDPFFNRRINERRMGDDEGWKASRRAQRRLLCEKSTTTTTPSDQAACGFAVEEQDVGDDELVATLPRSSRCSFGG